MTLDLVTIAEARARLERIVAEARASYATQDYAKRRAAALKGLGR